MTREQADTILAQASAELAAARRLGHDVPALLVQTAFVCARCEAQFRITYGDGTFTTLKAGALDEPCRGAARRAELRWKLPTP